MPMTWSALWTRVHDATLREQWLITLGCLVVLAVLVALLAIFPVLGLTVVGVVLVLGAAFLPTLVMWTLLATIFDWDF